MRRLIVYSKLHKIRSNCSKKRMKRRENVTYEVEVEGKERGKIMDTRNYTLDNVFSVVKPSEIKKKKR